nr:DNA-directed DNA polymerase [Tanacetum cinerariifolium]
HGLLTLVQNKQFFGHGKEDPHAHVRYFNKITSTLKFPNVPNTSIKLMLFPFSLEGAAWIWLEKEPPRSIFTWDDLVLKFINQFFPPSKTTNLRNEITNFQQRFDETFSEAWDRFKDLPRACPHHGFSELHQLDTFYNALNSKDQDSLNSVARGNFLDRMPREYLGIIESKSKVQYSRNKPIVAKVSTTASTSGVSPDVAELKDMVRALLLDKKGQSPAPVKAVEESCVTCGGAHSYKNYPATDGNNYRHNIQEFVSQASAVNFNQGNTAQIWLEKEPPRSIFTWDDLVLKFINQFFPPSKTTNLRNEITNFQQRFDESFSEAWDRFKDLLRACPHRGFLELHQLNTFYNALNSKDQDSLNSATGATDGNFYRDNIQEFVSQASAVNYNQGNTSYRPLMIASTSSSGTLPSNTIANPRSDLKAITTRSGVSYDGPQIPPPPSFLPKVVENKPEATKDIVNPTNNESTEDVQPHVVQSKSPILNSEPITSPISKPVIAPIFKDMSFEISFVDALILMPKFSSTLKAFIGNKEKLSEMAQTLLNEHCSAVLLKKLPEKLGDPGKFLIPCDFPRMVECLALANLGASINLIPWSIWKRLSLANLTPTCKSNYRLRDWRSNGLRVKNWIFRLDNMRLDVFSAFIVSMIHYVLCHLWFIFHHFRKKRRRGWNLRLKNSPSKHLVFEEPELGKLEVRKPGVDKQRTIAGISLVVVNCGGLRNEFLNIVTIKVAIGGWIITNKQFFGHDKEDSHAHVRYFNKITSTLKFPNVSNTSINLMLFSFSLEGAARIWLEKEPPRSIFTWDDLVLKFINQFFPPSKTTNLRNEITNFKQRFDESFSEAWDRFKDLLRAYPHHGFLELHQLDIFYNALNSKDQDSLNSAAGDFDADPRVPLFLKRSFLKIGRALIDVCEGELTLCVGKESILRKFWVFNIISSGNPTPYYDLIVSTTSLTLTPLGNSDFLLEKVNAFLAIEDDPTSPKVDQSYLDPEGDILELKIYEAKFEKSLIDEPPEVELKDLPPHLEYAFLEGDDKQPIIIAKDLSVEEKTTLITVLKSHKRAIAWKLFDIKGIDLEFYTHKILMEEDFEPSVQHKRRVNPKIHDVIKEEHVCIDYQKLNEATCKDHFTLPFMDQMLERLAGNKYYCFHDGFSGYFQIPIDPKDQKKTTFTCAYGTFAYRHMPFGLCNALGTFQRCMIAIFHDMIEKTIKEVLGFSDVIASGNPTSYYDPIVSTTSSILTSFGNSDFLLEEVDVFLAIEDDPTSLKFYQPYLDPEGEILLLEAFLNDDPSLTPPNQGNYLPKVCKELKMCEAKSDKSLVDEVELKDLPPHLEYAFLEGDDKLLVIIAKDLSVEEKTALITVLKSHKRAIAWKLSDIKGENHASWSDKLDDALWAFRTAYKTPIRCTLYKLVYEKACHLPIELKHKAY